MRVLAPVLLALLMAGCLSAPTAPTSTTAAAPTPAVEAPKPVDIQRTIDLTQGSAAQSWKFTVAKGAKDALVDVTLQGLKGAPLHGPNNPCVSYTADSPTSHQQGSTGNCAGAGNVVVVGGSTTTGPTTMLRWEGSEVPVGSVVLSLSSQPTAGEAVVTVRIHY